MRTGLLASAGLALGWGLALAACSGSEENPRAPGGGPAVQRGLLLHEEGLTQPGYTLFSPVESETVYLVDLDGQVAHTWKTGYPFGGAVYLLEDGVLLRGGRKENNPRFHGGGIGGYVVKHAWDGSVLWRFELANEQRTMHHDFEVLPNGNTPPTCWGRPSPGEARAHGRAPARADGRQGQALILRGVADHRFGVAAARGDAGLLEHAAAQQDDAAIALAEVLLRAVGDGALADPGDEVLVHDMGGDPAPRARLGNGAVPVGDAVLCERLHLVGHPVEEPADA